MTRTQWATTIAIALGGVLGLVGILHGEPDALAEEDHEHGHGAPGAKEEPAKGPHGGRLLLGDDGFALELIIYEPGIPPQSRVYAYAGHKRPDPIAPAEVELEVELHRFDRVDVLGYTKQDDFLLGDKTVDEPHSFDVKVRATHRGKSYAWEYSSYEGRVEIGPEAARISGIAVEKVEPRRLVERLLVLGQVGFDQDAVRHISARYAGVARDLRKRVGDFANAGEVMAIVHGNESLTDFELRASGSGQVVEKRVTEGEVVEAGEPLYVIAGLGTVWVDFTVYRGDAPKVQSGQRVLVVPGDGLSPLEGKLAYLAPVGDAASQSVTARAVVRNATGELRPGMFVKGQIELGAVFAPAVIRRDAVQTFRDWQVVFRNKATTYEIAIVELGLEDGDFVEVRSGLRPGEMYVWANSFVVKAELGKAGATHDH